MHAPSSAPNTAPANEVRYLWALHRFACFCAGTILFLICLGGLVTSHEAGMSVPDWPTSYGYNMFFFPFQDWVGGIFFEHLHRLVASALGLLMLGLATWLCFQPRIWLRWLGWIAFFLTGGIGLLGGLRVLAAMDWIGIFHTSLAQTLFGLTTLIALFTSRWWIQTGHKIVPAKWPGRTAAITALIFAQLVVGATMRHEHAGLSIDDFPAAYGQAWPKTDPASVASYNQERVKRHEQPTTAFYILMQMVHRVGAVLIGCCIFAVTAAAWLTPGAASELRKWSSIWSGLVCAQIGLGAWTIWSNKAADVATTHVAIGALTLILGAILTAMSLRLREKA